jgi:hypothetical protein
MPRSVTANFNNRVKVVKSIYTALLPVGAIYEDSSMIIEFVEYTYKVNASRLGLTSHINVNFSHGHWINNS